MITDKYTYRQWLKDGATLPITVMRDTEWDPRNRVHRTKAWCVCVNTRYSENDTVAKFSKWNEAMDWADFVAKSTILTRSEYSVE